MIHNTPHYSSAAFLGGVLLVTVLQSCTKTETIRASIPVGQDFSQNLSSDEDDGAMASRIHAALLLSPVVGRADIVVTFHQGVAKLLGKTQDQTQVDLAVFVAQTVPGVNQVDGSMLVVATNPPANGEPSVL